MNKNILRQLIKEELKRALSEDEQIVDPQAEKDAELGLKKALAVLKAETNNIKPSPQDKEIKEGVGLTLGLIAGAPGLINALGKGVNWISSFFQKDEKKGTVVGNALKKWGHELEEAYIGIIGDMLKKAFPETYGSQDVHDNSSALYDAAHGIYASLLVAAAVSSGMGAAEAHSAIASGLEGGLAAFKGSEITGLATKIAAA
jgi:hypothetical protein